MKTFPCIYLELDRQDKVYRIWLQKNMNECHILRTYEYYELAMQETEIISEMLNRPFYVGE